MFPPAERDTNKVIIKGGKMNTKLKKAIDETLREFDIDKEERPQMARVVEKIAVKFYKLGREEVLETKRHKVLQLYDPSKVLLG